MRINIEIELNDVRSPKGAAKTLRAIADSLDHQGQGAAPATIDVREAYTARIPADPRTDAPSAAEPPARPAPTLTLVPTSEVPADSVAPAAQPAPQDASGVPQPSLDEMKRLLETAIGHPKMGGPKAVTDVIRNMGYARLTNGPDSVDPARYGELRDKINALLAQADAA